MKMDNLKNAFGNTPESVKECVLRSLREEQRREFAMKKKRMLSLAIALAVILALGCIGFAATQLEGVALFFGYVNQETGEAILNEAAISHIQALNETYEGKTVRFTLTEGLYSPAANSVSLFWTLEPIGEDEQYYVLCTESVGGQTLEGAGHYDVSEYFLKSPTQCVLTGRAKGEGLETELKFTILKLKGEPTRISGWDDEKETEEEFWQRIDALIADGKLPVAGDGVIEVRPIRDKTYSEELVIAGVAELAEEFTVAFDLAKINPVNEMRVYEGEKTFDFDGFTVCINELVVSPADSRISFDILCDEESLAKDIVRGGFVRFCPPGEEYWMGAAYPRFLAPVRTGDGRWKVSVAYDVTQQLTYPEELVLSIAAADENRSAVPLTGEGILLKLTDK